MSNDLVLLRPSTASSGLLDRRRRRGLTSDLGAGTNSTLAIAGDTPVTGAGFPQGAGGSEGQLVILKLGAEQ